MKSEENGVYFDGEALAGILSELAGKGKCFRFRVAGFSMSPFIRDADIVTIAPLSRAPGFGRPVAYFDPLTRKLVIHRLIGKAGDRYIVKGDNLESPDAPVPRGNILGYVSRIDRGGREKSLGCGPAGGVIAILSRFNLLSRLLSLKRRLRHGQ
ncbi:MAG: S24/S26 family peptidase [Deltaproteobacteria bacterium]